MHDDVIAGAAKKAVHGEFRLKISQAQYSEVLRSTPLVLEAESEDGKNPGHLDRELPANSSVLVGLGLCTHKEVSKGVPLDGLGMVLASVSLSRRLGFPRVLAVVGDHLARESEIDAAPREGIERLDELIGLYVQTLSRVKALFGLEELTVIRSSEVASLDAYLEWRDRLVCPRRTTLLRGRHRIEVPMYARLQDATVMTLVERHGVVIKVGWTLPREGRRSRCEECFDAITRNGLREFAPERVPQLPSFVYTHPGYTVDRSCLRVVPYAAFARDADKRVLVCAASGKDTVPAAVSLIMRLAKLRNEGRSRDRRRAARVLSQIEGILGLAGEVQGREIVTAEGELCARTAHLLTSLRDAALPEGEGDLPVGSGGEP